MYFIPSAVWAQLFLFNLNICIPIFSLQVSYNRCRGSLILISVKVLSDTSLTQQSKKPDKVMTEVGLVAQSHCEAEPVSSRLCEFRGMFSNSVIVTLSDGT